MKTNTSNSKDTKLKNNIMTFIFCEPCPTYSDFIKNKKIQPFQVCQDYEYHDYESLVKEIDNKVAEYYSNQAIMEDTSDTAYSIRKVAEFGTTEDIIKKLCSISYLNPNIITTQGYLDNEDIISVEIVFDENKIDLIELSKEFYHSFSVEMISKENGIDVIDLIEESSCSLNEKSKAKEIELLITAIEQAQANNEDTLYLFDN